MIEYYCHKCSVELGFIPGEKIDYKPTGSTYQFDKYYKHTVPSKNSKITSIFNDEKKYKSYLINTLASGGIIMSDGSIAVVWIAGEKTGFTIADGKFQCNCDSVKVVLHDDELEIHGYPTGSAKISTETCLRCGNPIGY